MPLANVALTDTFDTWRTRTNQIIVSLDQNDTTTALAYNKANSANYYTYLVDANTTAAFDKANSANIVASSAFDKANSANSLAYNTGIGANTFLLATISGANTAVGTGANAFASATISGANTAVGTGANAYAATVGTSANTFLLATIAGANTAVGTGANSYATAVGTAANTVSIAAFNRANLSLLSTSYTASDVLSKLLTVDGAGSGLDADTVDGYHGTAFVRAVSIVNPNSPVSGYQTLGSVSASISSGTLTITLNWVDIAEHPYVPPPPPPGP